MIRFINENGETFDGVYPYIHWLNGQLSTELWYTVKLMFVSDQETLQTSELDEKSVYRFITPDAYSHVGEDLDLDTISVRSITSTGVRVQFDDPNVDWFIHQILLVCSSDTPGEYIEKFNIGDGAVAVGVDLYELDETLQINLSNRGLEVPTSIQKAFLDTDIHEDENDYALLNRKFKELISNFIDIVDCKGSYESLYNALKWFEWGEGTRLYEVWQGENMYFEKELRHVLSDVYTNLLFTHRKTTHLSLVAAVQEFDEEASIITDPNNPGFNDMNPVIKDNDTLKPWIEQWTNDELALKVSLLGLFFERYFMPIHLDLKRACIECLVTTNQIKTLSGVHEDKFHYHEDTGVIEIDMDHTVTLGNVKAVAVGADTVFGKRITLNDMPVEGETGPKFIDPIGVDLLNNIKSIGVEDEYFSELDFNNDYGSSDFAVFVSEESTPSTSYEHSPCSVATFYLQLKGGVGVVVPVSVRVKLPSDDAIRTETITTYRTRKGETIQTVDQVTDHRLYRSDSDGYVNFSFNLLSTCEELVSFSLMLVSVSGHVWTVASSYECIDVRGSYLDIYKVENGTFTNIDQWISNNQFVPYHSQFNPYVSPNDDDIKKIIQYIPYSETVGSSLFNQLIVIQNKMSGTDYDTDWMENLSVTNLFWVIGRSGKYDIDGNEIDPSLLPPDISNKPKYAMLIVKDYGKVFANKTNFLTQLNGIAGTSFGLSDVKRFELIYIPQLHNYNEIGGSSLDDYTFNPNNLLCIYPQFTKTVAETIDQSSIFWEYTNKTTLETITVRQPLQTPLVARTGDKKLLTPGYWTVTMYYKLDGSSEIHKLTRNSAFKIV